MKNLGYLNDLWKWDGTSWTWVSGSNQKNKNASYGTKGVSTWTNNPGARSEAVGWADPSNNLWIFGGEQSGGGMCLL